MTPEPPEEAEFRIGFIFFLCIFICAGYSVHNMILRIYTG